MFLDVFGKEDSDSDTRPWQKDVSLLAPKITALGDYLHSRSEGDVGNGRDDSNESNDSHEHDADTNDTAGAENVQNGRTTKKRKRKMVEMNVVPPAQ